MAKKNVVSQLKKAAENMNNMAGKTLGGGSLALLAATKEVIVGHSGLHRRPHHLPFTSKGSEVNTLLKSKQTPPALSQLGKFLGITDPPQSDFSKVVSKFIKLHNRQNPGMRKDRHFQDKLVSILTTGQTIGIREIAKLLTN